MCQILTTRSQDGCGESLLQHKHKHEHKTGKDGRATRKREPLRAAVTAFAGAVVATSSGYHGARR